MDATEKENQNGTVEMQVCPVCNSENDITGVHCKVCAWYFPLKETPQFALELSRAKQQFQMVQSFNQVYQHMQVQSKVLEKMSYRLDGMEADMKKVKDENFLIVNPEVGAEEEPYPVLVPIKSVTELNALEEKQAWWDGLEGQWQKTFNAAFFRKGEITDTPNEKEFNELFISPTFRAVGPRGMYPNITFELTNLSGVKQLTNLEYLIVTHSALENVNGIEHLAKLSSLFCNSNKITEIGAVHYTENLKQIYCNANQLTSLLPLRSLTQLENIYCNYNQLQNFHGITQAHKENLKDFYCLPNDQLDNKEIKRMEEGLNIKCKKG